MNLRKRKVFSVVVVASCAAALFCNLDLMRDGNISGGDSKIVARHYLRIGLLSNEKQRVLHNRFDSEGNASFGDEGDIYIQYWVSFHP